MKKPLSSMNIPKIQPNKARKKSVSDLDSIKLDDKYIMKNEKEEDKYMNTNERKIFDKDMSEHKLQSSSSNKKPYNQPRYANNYKSNFSNLNYNIINHQTNSTTTTNSNNTINTNNNTELETKLNNRYELDIANYIDNENYGASNNKMNNYNNKNNNNNNNNNINDIHNENLVKNNMLLTKENNNLKKVIT